MQRARVLALVPQQQRRKLHEHDAQRDERAVPLQRRVGRQRDALVVQPVLQPVALQPAQATVMGRAETWRPANAPPRGC